MDADVIVIGSGFGGLGAAVELGRRGRRVMVLEAVNYPGGCASTHTRRGVRFESGATLATGVQPGQLFHRWLEDRGVEVVGTPLDPVLTQTLAIDGEGVSIDLPPSREGWIESLRPVLGDVDGMASFLDEQRAVGETLWKLFDQPELLPPLDLAAVVAHVGRLGRYLRVLPGVARPLSARLRRHGVGADGRRVVDGLCQITVQASSERAEAPFAMGAMEAFFRGTTHLDGGVGALARALVEVVERQEGCIRYAHRARGLVRADGVWVVETNRGAFRAPQVVANVLPADLAELLGVERRRLQAGEERVRTGWGACLLYRTLAAEAPLPARAFHEQILGDELVNGRSVFLSASGAGEERGMGDLRTLVASSHMAMGEGLPEEEAVAAMQERMRETLRWGAPALDAATTDEWTASPRTFQRFTRRSGGWVGGVPRWAGLGAYRGLWPRPVEEGLWMVGDSVLFGQSMLATAVGGARVAASMAR